jgi:hypothetical protein
MLLVKIMRLGLLAVGDRSLSPMSITKECGQENICVVFLGRHPSPLHTSSVFLTNTTFSTMARRRVPLRSSRLPPTYRRDVREDHASVDSWSEKERYRRPKQDPRDWRDVDPRDWRDDRRSSRNDYVSDRLPRREYRTDNYEHDYESNYSYDTFSDRPPRRRDYREDYESVDSSSDRSRRKTKGDSRRYYDDNASVDDYSMKRQYSDSDYELDSRLMRTSDPQISYRSMGTCRTNTQKSDRSKGTNTHRSDRSMGISIQRSDPSMGASTRKSYWSTGTSKHKSDRSMGTSTQRSDRSMGTSTQKSDCTSLDSRSIRSEDANSVESTFWSRRRQSRKSNLDASSQSTRSLDKFGMGRRNSVARLPVLAECYKSEEVEETSSNEHVERYTNAVLAADNMAATLESTDYDLKTNSDLTLKKSESYEKEGMERYATESDAKEDSVTKDTTSTPITKQTEATEESVEIELEGDKDSYYEIYIVDAASISTKKSLARLNSVIAKNDSMIPKDGSLVHPASPKSDEGEQVGNAGEMPPLTSAGTRVPELVMPVLKMGMRSDLSELSMSRGSSVVSELPELMTEDMISLYWEKWIVACRLAFFTQPKSVK